MLEELRKQVLEANLELVRRGLVLYTFGNASGISRAEGLVAIKPSGVPYEGMRPEDLVITDLDGRIVEGALRPSTGGLSKARYGLLRTLRRTWCCTGRFRGSPEWFTRIRAMPRRGRRRGVPSRAWAPRTRITFAARCR